MIPLLVQPISNEESTNILPVPWIRFLRCRFHGIDRLGHAEGVRMTKISPIDFKPELVSMMKSVLENASAYIDNESGKQARNISDQGEDGVAHPYNVADGVTDAGKLHSGAIEE